MIWFLVVFVIGMIAGTVMMGAFCADGGTYEDECIDQLIEIEQLQRELEEANEKDKGLEEKCDVIRDALWRINHSGRDWEAGIAGEALSAVGGGKAYHNPEDIARIESTERMIQQYKAQLEQKEES